MSIDSTIPETLHAALDHLSSGLHTVLQQAIAHLPDPTQTNVLRIAYMLGTPLVATGVLWCCTRMRAWWRRARGTGVGHGNYNYGGGGQNSYSPFGGNDRADDFVLVLPPVPLRLRQMVVSDARGEDGGGVGDGFRDEVKDEVKNKVEDGDKDEDDDEDEDEDESEDENEEKGKYNDNFKNDMGIKTAIDSDTDEYPPQSDDYGSEQEHNTDTDTDTNEQEARDDDQDSHSDDESPRDINHLYPTDSPQHRPKPWVPATRTEPR